MALRGNSGQCSRNRNKVCSVLSGDKTLLPCQVPLSDSVVVVQSPGCVWLFVTPWTTARQAFLSLTISQGLPKFMLIALVIPSSHLIVRHPLLLQPSVFPSIRDFCSELSFLIRWPKYWSFNFNISLSSEYSGLISLKVDCFDLLAVQRTFRHLLQHHSLKASILWRSAFFMVQLSTTVHDHWEDHGLDYMDLYQQRDVSASQVKLVVKSPSVSTGDIKDMDSIPGSRRFPWGGHGNPIHYSCLGNPMDREAIRSQRVTRDRGDLAHTCMCKENVLYKWNNLINSIT